MKTSLCVATPMYGGMCSGLYTTSLMQSIVQLSAMGVPVSYQFIMNESLVTRARNRLVYDFLQGNNTHLVFIDADIGFNLDTLNKMLAEDKDVVCALCPKKEINWVTVANSAREGVADIDLQHRASSIVANTLGGVAYSFNRKDCVEIEAGGAGIMMIKREVLEAVTPIVPSYINDVFAAVDGANPIEIKEFFTTSICPDSKRLLSEDYHFCRLARSVGKKIWGCPYPGLIHTGTYNYR